MSKVVENVAAENANTADANSANTSAGANASQNEPNQSATPKSEQEKIEEILIDRKEVGYWRGRVYYMQLEEMTIPQRPENYQILEISDKIITVKPRVTSLQSE